MSAWLPIEDESTPFNVDIELWSPRMGIRWGRHQVVGMINSGTFERGWVDLQGGIIEPTHWRPIRPPNEDDPHPALLEVAREVVALYGDKPELIEGRDGSWGDKLCFVEQQLLDKARAAVAKAENRE